jgi:hypothetical protein
MSHSPMNGLSLESSLGLRTDFLVKRRHFFATLMMKLDWNAPVSGQMLSKNVTLSETRFRGV